MLLAPGLRARGGPVELQARFDPVGAVAHARWHGSIRFIDTGPADGSALVFFGGLATSAGACLLTEFARTTRERLGLRLICVERNGFGETPFDPNRGVSDVVSDVLAVLGLLGVERFGIVAISGGGPFAAALAAAAAPRVVSLHLAAVAAGADAPLSPQAVPREPRAMWQFPPDSPIHRIPGFARAAEEEGVRALGSDVRGLAAFEHELRLIRTTPLPDLRHMRAPSYLYLGSADDIVGPEHAAAWCAALPNVVAVRRYEGEGHDVQYRHWSQILVDAAELGDRVLVTLGGQTWLVPAQALPEGAPLGLSCWNSKENEI